MDWDWKWWLGFAVALTAIGAGIAPAAWPQKRRALAITSVACFTLAAIILAGLLLPWLFRAGPMAVGLFYVAVTLTLCLVLLVVTQERSAHGASGSQLDESRSAMRPVVMLAASAKAAARSKITMNRNGHRSDRGRRGRLETITLEEPIWVQFQYSLRNSGETTSHPFPGLRLLAAPRRRGEPAPVRGRRLHYEDVTWSPRATGGESQLFSQGEEIKLPARSTTDVEGRVWFDIEECQKMVMECDFWFEIGAEIVGQETIVRRLPILKSQQP